MKTLKYYFFFIGVSLTLFSCIGGANLSGFTAYKLPITDGSSTAIKFYPGLYVVKSHLDSDDKSEKMAIVFNVNGFSKLLSIETDNPKNNGLKNRIVKNRNYWDIYEMPAVYNISKDTLYLQFFIKDNQAFYKRHVIENKFKILNDTTLLRYQIIINKEFPTNPIKIIPKNDTLVYYHKSDIDFNINEQWYFNKKWYRENLHESRN